MFFLKKYMKKEKKIYIHILLMHLEYTHESRMFFLFFSSA